MSNDPYSCCPNEHRYDDTCLVKLADCPRCGSEIKWMKIFNDREEFFAMCTKCTWGED